jgi:hypothetical protein
MAPRYKGRILLALVMFAASHARAQQWYTAEVAKEVKREWCEKCTLGRGDDKPVKTGAGRITPVTMFYFDTIATYSQGRVVDAITGKPIAGAFIQTRYSCWEDCTVKAGATNKAGFFRLGWVGCHGLKGGRSNRPLLIRAAGYQTISTEAVSFGGGAYLHIELAPVRTRR